MGHHPGFFFALLVFYYFGFSFVIPISFCYQNRKDYKLYVHIVLYKGDNMGYKTKIQLIQRKDSQQWLFNIPAAIGASLELKKGEILYLSIKDKNCLIVRRA